MYRYPKTPTLVRILHSNIGHLIGELVWWLRTGRHEHWLFERGRS